MEMKTCQFPGCTNVFPEYTPSSICGKSHVFLGGVCGKNSWRDGFIDRLVARKVPRTALFNPVVTEWTVECQVREDFAKRTAAVCLYYLADSKTGEASLPVYSLVEATMALYDKSEEQTVIVVIDDEGLSGHALKVLRKIRADLQKRFGPDVVLSALDQAEKIIARSA